MSSEFGYIPESPTQSFGNNKGIFTPTDIYDLTRAGKYTNYGQLELIQTQNISSAVAQVDFTSIQETKYSVHLLTWNGIEIQSNNNYIGARLSNDGGSSYESGSNYQYSIQYNGTAGIEGNLKSTGDTAFEYFNWGDVGDTLSGFLYFYSLGDSTKYSFMNMQTCINIEASYGNGFAYYGAQVYAVKETINAIRLFNYNTSGNFENKGSFSLYGIEEFA